MKKLIEIDVYLPDETGVCERLAKTMRQFNAITCMINTGLITSAVITGEVCIAACASGFALPIRIVLSGTIPL